MNQSLYEGEKRINEPDPDETPIQGRKLLTQPYDLSIESMVRQIKDRTLHLRPLSDRPSFQRRYVWTNKLASLLIESILLNVPIPPVYLSQNEAFELDVIDGQQRIYSIYRFHENQFALTGLEAISEINGNRFHELERKLQRQIETHTLRAVIITNDSDPDIQFDVFERLNTNTMPLNAQELRNCMYRGKLNELLGELTEYENWLMILGRKVADKRLRDEELILRFFAFYLEGLEKYRTPQKRWLNDVADEGRGYSDEKIMELRTVWTSAIDNCLIIFAPHDCFRRIDGESRRPPINRALMDLTMTTLAQKPSKLVRVKAKKFKSMYLKLLQNDEFQDLISRSIDHKSRTLRRFEIWNERLVAQVF